MTQRSTTNDSGPRRLGFSFLIITTLVPFSPAVDISVSTGSPAGTVSVNMAHSGHDMHLSQVPGNPNRISFLSQWGDTVDAGQPIFAGDFASVLSPTRFHARLLVSATLPNSGAVKVIKALSQGYVPIFGTTIRDFTSPAGSLSALREGVSAAPDGTGNVLCEGTPTVGARFLYRISVPYDALESATTQSFSLPLGATVLDTEPTSNGGFVVLVGSESSASTIYVDASGTFFGPFPVGAASQIAYSSWGGGLIFTAGRTVGGNMTFTKGPLFAGFTDSSMAALPYPNLDFHFECGDGVENGSCWWGGFFVTLGGDRNGFMGRHDATGSMDFVDEDIVGSSPADETVHSVAVEPYGVGVVAADGILRVFNTETGATMASYPAVPDPAIEFLEVKVQLHRLQPNYPSSAFGAFAIDTRNQEGHYAFVRLRGEAKQAYTSSQAYTGGATPTLYVEVYQRLSTTTSLPLSSSSANVTVPASVDFPSHLAATAQVTMQTVPVAVTEQVTITSGSAPKQALATFTLLAPRPTAMTPASQTVIGGSGGVIRLGMTGRAPGGGLNVPLQSDGPEVTVPASVIVPAGLYSRSFVFHSTPVAATVIRSVTATYDGVSKSASITINP